jgi:hypothetical protein
MPMPKRYRDELVESHERAHREARSETFRDLLRTAGHLAFWVACGLLCIGLALHSSDKGVGMIFWWGGHAVWLGGVSFSLLAAYRRGEHRGDW